MKTEPNQALEPTTTAVTPRADARVAPAVVAAHLYRWAIEDEYTNYLDRHFCSRLRAAARFEA